MIPTLPKSMSDAATLEFYDTLSGNLSDQSSIHTNWHTHRGNPSICWICDQTTLLSMVITLAFKINTKSTVDIETDEEQCDSEFDTEIEEMSLNKDDETYNEPEYETEEIPDRLPTELDDK